MNLTKGLCMQPLNFETVDLSLQKLTDRVLYSNVLSCVNSDNIKFKNLCTPVCDSIFSDIDNNKVDSKMIISLLGNCDTICSCVCSPVGTHNLCDSIW